MIRLGSGLDPFAIQLLQFDTHTESSNGQKSPFLRTAIICPISVCPLNGKRVLCRKTCTRHNFVIISPLPLDPRSSENVFCVEIKNFLIYFSFFTLQQPAWNRCRPYLQMHLSVFHDFQGPLGKERGLPVRSSDSFTSYV